LELLMGMPPVRHCAGAKHPRQSRAPRTQEIEVTASCHYRLTRIRCIKLRMCYVEKHTYVCLEQRFRASGESDTLGRFLSARHCDGAPYATAAISRTVSADNRSGSLSLSPLVALTLLIAYECATSRNTLRVRASEESDAVILKHKRLSGTAQNLPSLVSRPVSGIQHASRA